MNPRAKHTGGFAGGCLGKLGMTANRHSEGAQRLMNLRAKHTSGFAGGCLGKLGMTT